MTPPGTVGTAGIYIVAAANFPTELANFLPFPSVTGYRIEYAIMWYSSDWSPTATYPQVAYWFEFMAQPSSSSSSGLYRGAGLVANASVSQTPTPIIHTANQVAVPGLAALGGDPILFTTHYGHASGLSAAIGSPNNQSTASVLVTQNGSNQAGVVNTIGASGKVILSMGVISPDPVGALTAGGIVSFTDTPWTTPQLAYFPQISMSGGSQISAAALNGSKAGTTPAGARKE